jgi:hypothetical protein
VRKFAVGKTGSSTVRRSLAVRLVNELTLVAVPRNLAKPDGSANFGLDAASEARMSGWIWSSGFHWRLGASMMTPSLTKWRPRSCADYDPVGNLVSARAMTAGPARDVTE